MRHQAGILLLQYIGYLSILTASSTSTVFAARVLGNYAALGDSFSAGPAAGEKYTRDDPDGRNNACSRYEGAYPPQLWNDNRTPGRGSFRFISCTGDVTANIEGQVAKMVGDERTVTLSIGGNDAHFGDVIKACIYRFNYFEGDSSCNDALNAADQVISGNDIRYALFDAYGKVIRKAGWDREFRLYITAYAQFFNEYTDQCDDASFGYWRANKPKLTHALRQRMNSLVLRMNDIIKEVTELYTEVQIVEWDDAMTGHRFCEENIVEPDYETEQTYFYNLYTPSNMLGATVVPSDFADVDTATCEAASGTSRNFDAQARCDIARSFARDPSLNSGDGYIPDSYSRIFHPRPPGFRLMKDAILAKMSDDHPYTTNHSLRILPLGDSITNGYMSSDLNGYRGPLASYLTGNAVDFVGSQQSGTMSDGEHEGVNGAKINEIASNAERSYARRPNLVLLHAGTNDLNSNFEVSTAPSRLANLIDKIFDECPDTTILVGTLIFFGNQDMRSRIWDYNREVIGIVEERRAKGKHILVAAMGDIQSNELADGLHPNDQGYRRMAGIWEITLREAVANSWIKDPVATESSKVYCPKDVYWIEQGEIASGGAYLGGKGGRVMFADLTGNGRADYLWVENSGKVSMFLNKGRKNPSELHGGNGAKVDWEPQGVVATGPGISTPGKVMFADLNGDGRDDYLWVHNATGAVTAFINGGFTEKTATQPAQLIWHPNGEIASGAGQTTNANVRFAHIQGKTREDYVILQTYEQGGILGFFNGGNKNGPNHALAGQVDWYPQGKIHLGWPDMPGVFTRNEFADIDGDGRDDLLDIGSSGSVFLYKNNGTQPNQAVKVDWIVEGEIASGVGTHGSRIMFADINGDGRDEYLDVDPKTGAVKAWLNGC